MSDGKRLFEEATNTTVDERPTLSDATQDIGRVVQTMLDNAEPKLGMEPVGYVLTICAIEPVKDGREGECEVLTSAILNVSNTLAQQGKDAVIDRLSVSTNDLMKQELDKLRQQDDE